MVSAAPWHMNRGGLQPFLEIFSRMCKEPWDFYIPLLTMNMISRDLSGGTIKLLQSAPLRNAEIGVG